MIRRKWVAVDRHVGYGHAIEGYEAVKPRTLSQVCFSIVKYLVLVLVLVTALMVTFSTRA
jgi:hypothetical protein